jgi:hypothetical protein
MCRSVVRSLSVVLSCGLASSATAQSPFATAVVDYRPAPGQFVNNELFNDPGKALGRPYGGGFEEPGNSSLVTLGGFGGSITLAFDHTVMDDPANPFGVDAIVYGNALWVSSDPNRRWVEGGMIEISRDANGNGLADDPWFLIPGSHIADPAGQYETQSWDDDIADLTYPPEDALWLPPGESGAWTTAAYRLPAIFEVTVMENPLGLDAEDEGVFGYADCSPTMDLPDGALAEEFYTRPDYPLRVGLTPGCGGGDAIDIAWAVDAVTGEPTGLEGFDFLRVTTAVNVVIMPFGELSPEIDAVADVEEGQFGDAENDGDVDFDDVSLAVGCIWGPGVAMPTCPCRVMDFDQDADVDLSDVAELQVVFAGS